MSKSAVVVGRVFSLWPIDGYKPPTLAGHRDVPVAVAFTGADLALLLLLLLLLSWQLQAFPTNDLFACLVVVVVAVCRPFARMVFRLLCAEARYQCARKAVPELTQRA